MSFSNADLLPWRLSVAGCRNAGSLVQEQAGALTAAGVTLAEAIVEGVERVTQATEQLENISGNELSMRRLDAGADRCIDAFASILDNLARCLEGDEVLALTEEERDLAKRAEELRLCLFPGGTTFLNEPYRQQWERMVQLCELMAQPECTSALEDLGLSLHRGRIRRWVERYGNALGFTNSEGEADEVATRVQRWHDAYGDLIVATRVHCSDRETDAHFQIRRALLGPYEREAHAERLRANRRRFF